MAVDRRSALGNQKILTGIDFIQVVDPQVQTLLRVFFIVDPSTLEPAPLGSSAGAQPPGPNEDAGPPHAEPGIVAAISSVESGERVRVSSIAWRKVRVPSGIRLALEIEVTEPGGFSPSIIELRPAAPGGALAVDPFFNRLTFSFKQGCPSDFDCRVDCDPVPAEGPDATVDYLARDFHSFRRALLDFAAERYPGWSQPLEADEAVMLVEIMAALGDEFAYAQDRIARELALDTASQRRSRSGLARLVDYLPDPGRAAVAELTVFVRAGAGGASPEAGARVWAMPEGRSPIPFTVRPRADGEAVAWHHEFWNEVPLHQPDSDVACLPEGSTEALLVMSAQLPPGAPGPAATFWRGRRAVLRVRPDVGPARAFPITIDEVGAAEADTLSGPVPIELARIRWTEPTPWAMPLADSRALLNVVAAVAGEVRTERFRVGSDDEVLARHPALTLRDMRTLPRAVERGGAFDAGRGARELALRYGLRGSEALGLGWEGGRDPLGLGTGERRRPMLAVDELPTVAGAGPIEWTFKPALIDAGSDELAYTLEEGIWRNLVEHQAPSGDFVFEDYAGDSGWSLRFGDGEFGRRPAAGTIFEATYFSAPGAAANLAADSVTRFVAPPGTPPGPTLAYAAAVTNPLPVAGGADEESAEDIRINAPEAWRALPLRAVRPEDYGALLGRLPWVQRAAATPAWTGSWSTDFVAADPVGGVAYEDAERAELEAKVECIRLAGRDARVVEPAYLDIDLAVDLCVAAGAYPGEVVPRVLRALGPPGLFASDNFTFGQPLRRSRIEAAIQSVPGVKAVERIRVRVRRDGEWRPFDRPELPVAPGQIIRLQNDLRFPSRGTLRVEARGGAA